MKFITVLDSWGNIPAGQYYGNKIDYGHFDQCLETNSETTYCLVDMRNTKNSFDFQTSICVPSSCTATQVTEFLENLTKNSQINDVKFLGRIERCIPSTQRENGKFERISLIIGTIILLLVIISTLNHALNGATTKNYKTSFSLIRNFPKLIETNNYQQQQQHENNHLECLNGIRVLTLLWIVVMHNFFYLTDFVSSMYNKDDFVQQKSSPWFLFMLQAQLGADTFFIISGLCVSYNFMKARNKGLVYISFFIFLFFIVIVFQGTIQLETILLSSIHSINAYQNCSYGDLNFHIQCEIWASL